ncbi:hypothetical protein TNCT_215811, partial [Trichonephila clavata]
MSLTSVLCKITVPEFDGVSPWVLGHFC